MARAWRLGREEGAHCQREATIARRRVKARAILCVAEKMRDGKVRVPARE